MSEIGRLWRGVERVARTRYPGFIVGLPLSSREIPVFTYHDVESASFARDLDFLRDNGYRTIGLDEYLGVRSGKYRNAPRSVLLTFDDARESFYRVAVPLLDSFDAHAVLFAPTYWMDENVRSAGDTQFMSWSQMRDCVASGHVDVESHAHRHALVAVSSDLIDFAHPEALQRFDIYDWPMRNAAQGDVLGRPALGTPVYRSMPLLSATTRYVENDALTDALQDYVRRNGGPSFFVRAKWRETLLREYRKRSSELAGEQTSAADMEQLVTSELELTVAAFRRQLGYAPRTLAYPWMLGTTRSVELARTHGFEAVFGVALDFRAERRGNLALPVYGRFKCDWLQFLPGRRRSNVFSAIGQKVREFAGAQHLAH